MALRALARKRAASHRSLGGSALPASGTVPAWQGLLAVRRWFAALSEHTELQMPALSPTMSQGNVSSWQVKEGDEVAAGDVLAEIETDKATLEWENQDDGFVAKILVPAGSKDIPVGTPLAILVEDEGRIAAFRDYSAEATSQAGPSQSGADADAPSPPEPSGAPEPEQPSQRQRDGLRRLGPAARRMLQESGLSDADVSATGPLGIVTTGDVLAAIGRGQKPAPKAEQTSQAQPQKQPEAAAAKADQKPAQKPAQKQLQTAKEPVQGERYRDIPVPQIRKIIAQRLLESKTTVPHHYVRATADLEAVTMLRQTLKAQGTKVSVNDIIVRAVALALKEVPAANATWDAKAGEPRLMDSVDVAIAVATDSGLITPIIKAANTKSLTQISGEVRELAGRARANKLKPDEFQGGTFTISNLGMFGVDHFSAIINPPQAGILAVGGTQHRVHLEDGRPVSRAEIIVTLSADERVYDGEISASFLDALCANLANPVKLLV